MSWLHLLTWTAIFTRGRFTRGYHTPKPGSPVSGPSACPSRRECGRAPFYFCPAQRSGVPQSKDSYINSLMDFYNFMKQKFNSNFKPDIWHTFDHTDNAEVGLECFFLDVLCRLSRALIWATGSRSVADEFGWMLVFGFERGEGRCCCENSFPLSLCFS